ncbi:uncharacterized protein C19orf44 homolog [Rhynochetos jubatus]
MASGVGKQGTASGVGKQGTASGVGKQGTASGVGKQGMASGVGTAPGNTPRAGQSPARPRGAGPASPRRRPERSQHAPAPPRPSRSHGRHRYHTTTGSRPRAFAAPPSPRRALIGCDFQYGNQIGLAPPRAKCMLGVVVSAQAAVCLLVIGERGRRVRGLCTEPVRARDVGAWRCPGYGAALAPGGGSWRRLRTVPPGWLRSLRRRGRPRAGARSAAGSRPGLNLPQRRPRAACAWAAAGPGPVFEPRVGSAHTWEGEEGHSHAALRRASAAGRGGSPRASEVGTGLEETGRAPQSRFLKARGENVRAASASALQAASRQVAKSSPGSTSHARSRSALRKVAELESKIMNRKKQMELQNTDLGQKSWDEQSFSLDSSHEHRAKGKKYLKNYATASGSTAVSSARSREEESIQSPKKNATVKQQRGLDSKEEEIELMESSLEFARGNENWRVVVSDSEWAGKRKTAVSSGTPPLAPKGSSLTEVSKAPCFRSKDSEKNGVGGVNSPTPSPPSRNLSVQCNVRSQSLSSSMKDSAVKMALLSRGNAKQSQISLESDSSEIKSLDELFSKAADAEDPSSSSSDDFRLNILSLDDLAPNITSEATELKQKGTDIQITAESNRNPPKNTFLAEKDQTSLKMTTAVTGVNEASEGDIEKTVTEAEISEHLSGASADSSGCKPDYLDDRTLNSEYSEDFETSLSTTDRESASKTSEKRSKSCTRSGKHPSAASPALRARERHGPVRRVTVREAAVQTVASPCTCCWLKANASAVLDPPAGTHYTDPVPVASHVIGRDAIEALTAYSPSVLVLNAMLKQHLMLIQQFVENIHHLHVSLVESLESETFHYHTLEEAKEYIKNHKSPPLTIEQAREEVEKAQEEKLL